MFNQLTFAVGVKIVLFSETLFSPQEIILFFRTFCILVTKETIQRFISLMIKVFLVVSLGSIEA